MYSHKKQIGTFLLFFWGVGGAKSTKTWGLDLKGNHAQVFKYD